MARYSILDPIIRKKRNRLNIPPYEKIIKNLDERDLGVIPDIKIAKRLRVGVVHVEEEEKSWVFLGSARKHEWKPEEIAALGVLNDVQIEKKFGICHDVVRQKRLKLGIPACKYPFNRNKS